MNPPKNFKNVRKQYTLVISVIIDAISQAGYERRKKKELEGGMERNRRERRILKERKGEKVKENKEK